MKNDHVTQAADEGRTGVKLQDAFEALARSKGLWRFEKYDTGMYEYRDTRVAFDNFCAAYRSGMERAAEIAEEWDSPSKIRLHAGEMTAQEMRSVRAILKPVAAAIRKAASE
jgi:hypothetical protein